MNGRVIIMAVVVLLAGTSGGVRSNSSQQGGFPQYTIQALGTFGGSVSIGMDVNDLGQVAGGADLATGGRHAFLWLPEPDYGLPAGMTDLGVINPGQQSEAQGINNLGQVVGLSSGTGNPAFAFLWLPAPAYGFPIGLSDLGLNKALAKAINDSGQVVGSMLLPNSEDHAFLWDGPTGQVTDLSNSPLGVLSLAWDINNSSQVVSGPFIWDNGAYNDVGTLGGEITQGFAVNDFMQVAGWSERVPGERIFHAFVWSNGVMTDIGAALGLSSSRAEDINNSGWVLVGRRLYDVRSGTASILNDLLPPGNGWGVLDGRGMSHAGHITGIAWFEGRSQAFLMTPVSPAIPTVGDAGLVGMALLLLAAAALLVRRQVVFRQG